ncbi:MAG: flagellar hook protein FlgE [Hyphomicrobiales bacterium]|nr:flagellar hook protein FlgE [Hyphomicrobiales bacterium]
MSIFNAMITSVSGMTAQGNRLSTYAENIANSSTVGYKAASAQFETILGVQATHAYSSGSVATTVRYGIDQQGALTATSSPTDLAINGQGFFVVADGNGNPHLTRAGSFVLDNSGHLVNTAGFRLMGVQSTDGSSPTTETGFGGLSAIKIDTAGLAATPSTTGAFSMNLPSGASAVAAANLPSVNAASAQPTAKSSLVAYDNLGTAVNLDIYMSKTGANTWEAAAFDASKSTGGGFPYSSGPLATATLGFDSTSGALTTPSPGALSIPVPGGQTMSLDISGATQLGASFSVSQATVNGSAPSQFSKLKVAADGTISAVYQNGLTLPKYKIPLATAPSIDNLTPETGNIYDVSVASGNVIVGAPNSGALGSIMSSTLENSTVDIASELTAMIETQRSYTANSKAFQIASDATDVLVNLKA